MRLLLDTQAVCLWTLDRGLLPQRTAEVLRDRRNHVGVSAASCCEIAIKHARGKPQWPPGT